MQTHTPPGASLWARDSHCHTTKITSCLVHALSLSLSFYVTLSFYISLLYLCISLLFSLPFPHPLTLYPSVYVTLSLYLSLSLLSLLICNSISLFFLPLSLYHTLCLSLNSLTPSLALCFSLSLSPAPLLLLYLILYYFYILSHGTESTLLSNFGTHLDGFSCKHLI